jgi:hypothetical protein
VVRHLVENIMAYSHRDHDECQENGCPKRVEEFEIFKTVNGTTDFYIIAKK